MSDWLDEASGRKPGILKRLAAAMGFASYLRATVSETDNISSQQGKSRDFNPTVAVNNFFSLVYAAAQMNANAVARTPLRLYGRVRKGKAANFPMHRVPSRRKRYLAGRIEHAPSSRVVSKIISFGEDFQEVTDHPALDVLRGVNRWMNAYDMSVLRILYLELTGNAYCFVRNGAIKGRAYPMELWPMPSQWMKVVPSRDQDSPIISGYVYGRNQAEEQYYEPNEIIRWNYPNPRNLYYGLGKVEAAWREICLRNSKSQHDQAIFDNGARPDYVVLLKGAPAGEITRFQKETESRLRGARNRGKFLAINADQASVMPITFTAEQLGDQDRVIEAICNVFGVPNAKFLTNKNVAGGQAGVSDIGYLRDTVLPICRMDEETLNADFLPRFDGAADDLVFAYDNPVPDDRAAQLADDTMRLTQGAITRDEWRSENGYDAMGGNAAELMVPSTLKPIDQEPIQASPMLPVGADKGDAPVDGEPEDEEKAKALLARIAVLDEQQAKLDALVKSLPPDDSAEKMVRVMAEAIEAVKGCNVTKATGDLAKPQEDTVDERQHKERALLALLLLFWQSQKSDILGTIDPTNHQPIAPRADWDAKLSAALLGGMVPIGFESAHDSAQKLGINLSSREVNAEVQDQLQSVADKFSPLINQTTIDRVNEAIAGVTSGAANADDLLRTAIGIAFNDAVELRGPAIASDGAFIATQAGTIAPGIVANTTPGVAVTAEWYCVEDDRLCPVCAPLNGRVVIAGTEFAPNVFLPVVDTHPLCRCVMTLGTKPPNYPAAVAQEAPQ